MAPPVGNFVTIGCRLPAGMNLEIGLQTTVRGGPQNGLVPQIKRMPNYRRIRINGTHARHAPLFREGIRMPATLRPEPFLTRVPADFWEAWKKEHEGTSLLRNGELFEVRNVQDAHGVKAQIIDASARPQPLAPLDPNEKFKFGKETVEKAEFEDKSEDGK
jgi:hypothetical protein